MTPYVELQVTSNFSFLRGASHPEELVGAAAALGHPAIAIADLNSLAGVVRAHKAAHAAGIRLVVGARLGLTDGPQLLCFPTDRAAYGRLARLLTLGKRRAPKGQCVLGLDDVTDHAEGQLIIALPPEAPDAAFAARLQALRRRLAGRLYLAARHLYRGDDAARIARLAELAEHCRTPLVAGNDVHAHDPARRPLQDVLTCIRERCSIDQAGRRLFANAERHLKPGDEMARLFRRWPQAVRRTVAIAERCRFSLDELSYTYPDEVTGNGRDADQELAHLTRRGAAGRYPGGVPAPVEAQIRHELKLIAELRYAPYFLTVHDIVRFARARDILCQGRGSAANSAVCYCLGITAVDPSRVDLLFERFISAERDEPPDIDVDFEHERREEVIQYIYGKYGRDHAGLAATVICFRARRATREVAKAMGLSGDVVDALARQARGWGGDAGCAADEVRQLGLDPAEPRLALALELSRRLIGFPRHLSQHVGGFVITREPLCEVVPIENAAMPGRTVIEWNKDDLDTLGILKVDVLGLGMLTCLSKGFRMLRESYGRRLDLASVPAEDSEVYDMLCRADSIGVFQVESRAQMSFLPRLKPRGFYDLVIQVAIVRPGPIQGDMVHPYLRRRNGEEAVDYPSQALRRVLEKTLGVPLFQEQAMKLAIVAAGFTPAEADRLRRAMATFRHVGTIGEFRDKFIRGMAVRGYARDFAERCFRQIEGFGEYGFPESHAASFALLAYVSAWFKHHYPAVFAAALLNSQPMGFYAPAQIVGDATRHGVEARPVDVNHSDWDCTLEPGPAGMALRLGLRQVKGLARAEADRLVATRGNGYADPRALWRRARLAPATLETLARADAFRSIGLDRRRALWAVRGLGPAPLPLFAAMGEAEHGPEPEARLPVMTQGQHVVEDYVALRLSLKAHPLAFLRQRLDRDGVTANARLMDAANGRRLTVAGLVLVRQRPGTAHGVIFATLEDETGTANVIVWPSVYAAYRRPLLAARLLQVTGRLQRQGIVIHVIAEHLVDRSELLHELSDAPAPAVPDPGLARVFRSRDFH